MPLNDSTEAETYRRMVLAQADEIAILKRQLTEEIKEKLRKDYVEGGLVSKNYPVPFVKLDPKNRESDDLGGISYAEQMKKLGF